MMLLGIDGGPCHECRRTDRPLTEITTATGTRIQMCHECVGILWRLLTLVKQGKGTVTSIGSRPRMKP